MSFDNHVIKRFEVNDEYGVGSVTIPSWATKVVFDFYCNGGLNESDNIGLQMRVNGDTGTNYSQVYRYHDGTSYLYANSGGATSWSVNRFNYDENDGCSRVVIYPRKDAAQYSHGMGYAYRKDPDSYQVYYLRWINTVDDITSVSLFFAIANRYSVSVVARAYR